MADGSVEAEVAFEALDGLPLGAVLYTPENPERFGSLPAVVIAPGGVGDRYTDAKLGRALARRGHTALNIDTRGMGWQWSWNGKQYGLGHTRIDECPLDIAAAVDYMRKLGHRRFLLSGQSGGALKVAYTQAAAPVEGVVGVVIWTGPRFSAEALAQLGEPFATTLRESEALVAAGKGETIVEATTPVKGPFAAAAFLDRYGPHGRYDWVTNALKINVPRLIIIGATETEGLVGAGLAEVQNWKELPPGTEVLIVPNWRHNSDGLGGEIRTECGRMIADWWLRVEAAHRTGAAGSARSSTATPG
jgi:dienelactone hydrolase